MRIFITGVSSFVGKSLIKKLSKFKNIKIYGCDLKNINNKYYRIDISKKDFYKKIPKKIDTLIHLAAVSRDQDCTKNLSKCYQSNVNGTLNVLEAIKKNKIKKTIFASTEWVYPDNIAKKNPNEKSIIDIFDLKSEYAKSKILSETHLKNFYLNNLNYDISILRFGIIYGERKSNWSAVESIFNKLINQDKIEIGSIKTARKFIHIEDICYGIIKSIKLKKFNIINLQGPELITLGKLIKITEKILNKKIKIYEKNGNNPSIRNISSSISFRKLKFKPEISLREGIQRLNKYFN